MEKIAIERIRAINRTLYGAELLDYEDRNWLAANPKVRSEWKQELHRELESIIERELKEG